MELITTKFDSLPGHIDRSLSSSALPSKLSLSLYNDPPTEELSLDDFEMFALDRLQLLRNIENLKIRGFEAVEYKQKLDAVYLSS